MQKVMHQIGTLTIKLLANVLLQGVFANKHIGDRNG